MSDNPNPIEIDEISKAYLEYLENYTNRNWDKMVDKFSSAMTMFGTGIDENAFCIEDTLNLFKREYKQTGGIKYIVKALEVFPLSDSLAYILAIIDMWFDCPSGIYDSSNNRTTAILKKEDGEWRIVHGHWSQPTSEQEEGESIPLKALKQRNKKLLKEIEERTREIEEQNRKLTCLNSTKDRLFSIIAHDLKSPFNSFIGFTDLMLANFDKNYSNPDYFKMRLGILQENAHTLYNITENLLDWSRSQCNEIVVNKRDFNLYDIVNHQIQIFDQQIGKKGIFIQNLIKKDTIVRSDIDIMAIIIRNFISNAIKYSSNNQVVTISCDQLNSSTNIIIQDQGIGMSEEQLHKLFIDFQSTPGTNNEKGTGLGLKICRELIDRIDGRLEIQSVQGKGCKVIMTLPNP
ncbi:MAG: hypothetical protein EHM93_05285 [Bacteroidales bacterium]|nr:MAG: hypothetical protein EHM93_05285 [Bacteroidales bacterium]